MEYSWIAYSLLASLCIGLYGFAQKVKAEMPEQSDNGFIFYSYFAMMLAGLIGWIFHGFHFDFFDIQILSFAFIITLLYIVIVKSRLISLRFLSSSSYFINYRIFSSTWLIVVWILLFWDTLSLKQIIWILLWFYVFYLLIEKKSKNETLSDLKKWFFYLLIGSFAVTWLQTLGKNFAISDFDVFTLIFYQGVLWCIMILLLKWQETFSEVFKIHHARQFLFLVWAGVVFGISTIFNIYALKEWNLALVYKVISYSLFIPIILSIIFYKEKITLKKLFAFALTIISIFLFF